MFVVNQTSFPFRADLPDTVSAQSDQVEAVREMTMHLYIMNARSKILMLIQSAQHNYLMVSSLSYVFMISKTRT